MNCTVIITGFINIIIIIIITTYYKTPQNTFEELNSTKRRLAGMSVAPLFYLIVFICLSYVCIS